MEHFKIYLRDRITDFNVYITSLPIRYYVSAKNRLYLINHKANARLSKTCELDENKVFLNTGISLFSSLLTRDSEPILTRDGVEIEVNYRRQDGDTHAVKLAGFMYNTYMKHSVNPISERMADPYNNAIKISSTIGNAYLSKYRTLAEMDSDDGVSLTLSHFDDMTLEDIDYIII